MVSNLPPHKESRGLTSSFHRFAMTALDLLDDDSLHPSHWELDRVRPSYTIETLEHFDSHHSEHQFCFIAGSDSLREIHLWKDYVKLLSNYCFIFVQRPGTETSPRDLGISEALKTRIRVVCNKESPAIGSGQSFLTTINAPSVSSTSVRRMVCSGQWPPSDMISPSVLQYIRKHRLYEKNQGCC